MQGQQKHTLHASGPQNPMHARPGRRIFRHLQLHEAIAAELGPLPGSRGDRAEIGFPRAGWSGRKSADHTLETRTAPRPQVTHELVNFRIGPVTQLRRHTQDSIPSRDRDARTITQRPRHGHRANPRHRRDLPQRSGRSWIISRVAHDALR
jgi:hypothetical protein